MPRPGLLRLTLFCHVCLASLAACPFLQVEPFSRALAEQHVDVMINGRRRDHGFDRAHLQARLARSRHWPCTAWGLAKDVRRSCAADIMHVDRNVRYKAALHAFVCMSQGSDGRLPACCIVVTAVHQWGQRRARSVRT